MFKIAILTLSAVKYRLFTIESKKILIVLKSFFRVKTLID